MVRLSADGRRLFTARCDTRPSVPERSVAAAVDGGVDVNFGRLVSVNVSGCVCCERVCLRLVLGVCFCCWK